MLSFEFWPILKPFARSSKLPAINRGQGIPSRKRFSYFTFYTITMYPQNSGLIESGSDTVSTIRQVASIVELKNGADTMPTFCIMVVSLWEISHTKSTPNTARAVANGMLLLFQWEAAVDLYNCWYVHRVNGKWHATCARPCAHDWGLSNALVRHVGPPHNPLHNIYQVCMKPN